MRYFVLHADPDLSNPVRIQKLDAKYYRNDIAEKEFAAIKRLQVAYFDNSPQVELCDVLYEPAFMVSDVLKRLFALYEPRMQFKGVQLFANDLEDNTAPLYWMPYIPYVECLGSESRRYPNGMLEKMTLDRMRIPKKQIFRVAGILEQKIIVNLPVAESMIRRNISGVVFEPAVLSGKE